MGYRSAWSMHMSPWISAGRYKFALQVVLLVKFLHPAVACSQDAAANALQMDEALVEFLVAESDVVSLGTFEFIPGNEPQDGIGNPGEKYELLFHPESVLKGDMALDQAHTIAIPNKYLSFANLLISRDEMFFNRQNCFLAFQEGFARQYESFQELLETRPGNSLEQELVDSLANRIANEVMVLTPKTRVYRPSSQTMDPVPVQHLVVPGRLYALLLRGHAEQRVRHYSLLQDDGSIYGGLDILFIRALLADD